jgi:DNA polymerase III sliding clamp (beta) subunit (PCNA family)
VVPVVASNHQGDDLVLGVNPTYLKDALTRNETFEMSCTGPTDAVRLDLGGDRVAVVMSFRL